MNPVFYMWKVYIAPSCNWRQSWSTESCISDNYTWTREKSDIQKPDEFAEEVVEKLISDMSTLQVQ